MLGPEAYESDPLRTLRLARFAAELGFAPDPETERLTRGGGAARPARPASACSASCAAWWSPTAPWPASS